METKKRINLTLSKVCLVGAGVFSLGSVAVEAAPSSFLTNSATGLSQVLADRLACPTTPSGSASADTVFWHARESMRNDFLETCTIKPNSTEDLVNSSRKKNTANIAALTSQAEQAFINRYEARSGKTASASVKKFAEVTAKAIVDARVHARNMGRRGWRCSEKDQTVTAIASRLIRVVRAAHNDSKNLVAGNQCAPVKAAGWNAWSDKTYSSDGRLSTLVAIDGSAPAPVEPVDPVEPIDPVEPSEPIEPVEPTDPVDPPQDDKVDVGEKPNTFAAQMSGGNIVRFKGGVNLNGFREPMVRWNECGDSKSILSGAYINDYSSEKQVAAYPASSKISRCANRKISEAFFNLLNENMKRCVAVAALPEAHSIINTTVRNSSRGSSSSTDPRLKAAIGRIEDAYGSKIAALEKNIKSIKIFHNGIQGDSRHSSRSYHSAYVLRAIDISYIVTKDAAGKQTVWQHNVGSYADRVSSPNAAQKKQVAFWRTFSACMTEAGGATITKVLYSHSSSYNHKGHVHLSLPYRNKGSYYSRDYEPGPAFRQ